MVGELGDQPEHPARIRREHRGGVIEIDHLRFRPVGGFSASSISITGMPSRIG
jgi:hypothetical protein